MSMIQCCKDCVPPKRCLGCHSTCKDYLKEKEKNDELLEKKRESKTVNNSYVEARYKRRQAAIKRSKRKRH